MNVRIYQINMKRDANNVAFMNYESLPKFQGSSEIDSSLYDKVFEGEVNCFTLEKLYEIFNLEHPAGYKGRSMSVSDVVEIIDGNTGKSYFHFCDSFGFQKVDFEPEKTQISDRFLSLAGQEKISVLLVPVGKSPVVKEIPNTYEAMKALIGGGGLDEYMPFEDDAAIVCNRDGKQEKLPMNRAVYQPPKRTHKLSAMFGRMSKEMAQDTKKLSAMQTELQGAKGHLKNMGLLFMGKAAKEAEHSKTDKGVLSRLSRLFEKAQKGFASLEQKAMDTADKLRVSRVKSSVKENLSRYRAAAKAEKGTERSEPTASKEENRTAQALGQISVPHPQKSNLSKER